MPQATAVGRGDIGNGFVPEGEALIEDTIADAFLRQFLPRPAEYDISATMSLSGDSISDAHPAQAGGIGVAPGANLRLENGVAILAAAQRTASRYTGPHRQGNGGCGEQKTPHLQFRAAFGKRPRGLDERARRWNDRRHIEPDRRQDGIESA